MHEQIGLLTLYVGLIFSATLYALRVCKRVYLG